MTIREQIDRHLKTDTDFNAFCMDIFPNVYKRFSDSMERKQKTNLLLSLVDQEVILNKLKLYQETPIRNDSKKDLSAQKLLKALEVANSSRRRRLVIASALLLLICCMVVIFIKVLIPFAQRWHQVNGAEPLASSPAPPHAEPRVSGALLSPPESPPSAAHKRRSKQTTLLGPARKLTTSETSVAPAPQNKEAFGCDLWSAGIHQCSDYQCPASEIQSGSDGCTWRAGKIVSSCSRSGAVGGCQAFDTNGSPTQSTKTCIRTAWWYTGSVDSIRQACEGFREKFVTP